MKKSRNITTLRPVKIYLDELKDIFEIVYSKYKKNDLVIETDEYFYSDFEDLSESSEGYIYKLRIKIKGKKRLEINFKDNIYIESENKNDLGLIIKINNILTDRRLIKSAFPYYFVKYNKIWYYIFVFITPLSLSLLFDNFNNYVYIFFASIIFYLLLYGIFLKKNAKNILYSTIVLHKKSSITLKRELELEDKKHYLRLTLIVQIIGLFIPLLVLFITYLITYIIGK